MVEETYSAGLISQSFWFVEMKKVIKLIDDGKSEEEIKKMCTTLFIKYDEIAKSEKVGDETTLKYRYLNLRNEKLTQNILMRHKIAKIACFLE